MGQAPSLSSGRGVSLAPHLEMKGMRWLGLLDMEGTSRLGPFLEMKVRPGLGPSSSLREGVG